MSIVLPFYVVTPLVFSAYLFFVDVLTLLVARYYNFDVLTRFAGCVSPYYDDGFAICD